MLARVTDGAEVPGGFYGAAQSAIHHERFGGVATAAAADLLAALAEAGHRSGTVVDLGCGSGILARIVGEAGHDVVGVDLSPSMVDLARAEAPAASITVGSVHDVDLPAGCVGVTAVGEVLNYATDARAGLDALRRLAERVHDALVPGGMWLLDLSGPGRGGPSGAVKQFHVADSWCLGMTATESPDQGRLDRAITIFTADVADASGRYHRVDEHHVVRLYDHDEVASLLREAGFAVEVADGFHTPAALPNALPGWYVVRASKPVA